MHTIFFGVTLLLFGMLFLHTVNVKAEEQAPLSESHKQRIIASCTSAMSSLRQLHRSDASLRVNRGQLYEHVGTKLMARLNGRIALNKLDGGTLVNFSAEYDRALISFRTSYRLYEEQLSSALRIDCEKQPEGFYYAVIDARKKRTDVYQGVNELNRLIRDYYQEFERFSSTYRTALKGIDYEQ
jgi:hypothetical protein